MKIHKSAAEVSILTLRLRNIAHGGRRYAGLSGGGGEVGEVAEGARGHRQVEPGDRGLALERLDRWVAMAKEKLPAGYLNLLAEHAAFYLEQACGEGYQLKFYEEEQAYLGR